MNCLLLLAGISTGKKTDGDYPLALTEFDGVTFLQKLFEKLSAIKSLQIIALVNEQDINKYSIDKIIGLLDPSAIVIATKGNTRGAPCTALLAIEQINNGSELLIVNGDELLTTSYSDLVQVFRSSKHVP